jgi:hypothetical protein
MRSKTMENNALQVLVEIGGWAKLAVSPETASKLITLLADAKQVESKWDGSESYLVEREGNVVMTLSADKILSRSTYDAIKEAKKAEKEDVIAAEQAAGNDE